MTTSYYIRKHSNSNSASVYVRVNEGRYKQFRFATGNDLNKASSWNDNTQSVRTNSIEPFDILNLQLRRLKAHIEAEYVHAKSMGIPRSKRFYKTAIAKFQLREMKVNSDHKLLTLGDAFEHYLNDAQAKKNGIRDVIFKGISHGRGECDRRPLISEPNALDKYSDYFNSFFADEGPYLDFVNLKDERILFAKIWRSRKRGSQSVTHGVVIRVLRSELKKKLLQDGIMR